MTTDFTYTLPAPGQHPLYDAGRKIASHVQRRAGVPTAFLDMEDAVQQATSTYWQHVSRPGKGPGYAWVAARRDLWHHLFTRNYNPRHTLSLDASRHPDNPRPWLDRLPAAELDTTGYAQRLTSDDLRALIVSLPPLPHTHTTNPETDLAILDRLRRGWSPNAIAHELGFTESTLASYRKRLRRRLKAYCQANEIPLPDDLGIHRQVGGYNLHPARPPKRGRDPLDPLAPEA